MLFGLGEGRDGKVEAWEEWWIGVYCGIRVVGINLRLLWKRGWVLAIEGAILDADQRRRVEGWYVLFGSSTYRPAHPEEVFGEMRVELRSWTWTSLGVPEALPVTWAVPANALAYPPYLTPHPSIFTFDTSVPLIITILLPPCLDRCGLDLAINAFEYTMPSLCFNFLKPKL